MSELPKVSGRNVTRTLADLEQACLVHLKSEQEKLSPDNGLIAALCDSVRLVREYSDSATLKTDATLRSRCERLEKANEFTSVESYESAAERWKKEHPDCPWCKRGDNPVILDRDGTLSLVSGLPGKPGHAFDDYSWHCDHYDNDGNCELCGPAPRVCECGHPDFHHDGGEGVCEPADEECECVKFSALTPPSVEPTQTKEAGLE